MPPADALETLRRLVPPGLIDAAYRALELAWWDGFRTGAAAGVAACVLAYLAARVARGRD